MDTLILILLQIFGVLLILVYCPSRDGLMPANGIILYLLPFRIIGESRKHLRVFWASLTGLIN